MLHKYIIVFFFISMVLVGNLSVSQTVWAETLVQSTAETRLIVALRVGQAELQKLVPPPWQIMTVPGGPFKEANFFVVFIESFLVQDAQGKPDMGGINRAVPLAAPVKNTQTGEVATIIVGGFMANISNVPGPYKNYVGATIRREQTHKGANVEGGVTDDFWEVRDTQGGTMELRVQYERALPLRTKQDQKLYSAAEPTFYRIYKQEMAMDLVKSTPTGVDHVKNYRLNVAIPKLKNLFDGSELVGVVAYPMFLRQIFLP
jgi:hypothetical protein